MKNILITALSAYNSDDPAQENTFTYMDAKGGEIVVTGKFTNDPVICMLDEKLWRQGERLDRIVLVCTSRSIKNVGDIRERVAARLRHMPDMVSVVIDEQGQSRSLIDGFIGIYNSIDPGATLYFDTTGGFRDIMMLLTSTIQLSKTTGFRMGGIYYCNYVAHVILERSELYSLFDMVSGLDEVLNYGSTKKVREYFEGQLQLAQEEQVLQALTDLCNEMKICRTNEIYRQIEQLRKAFRQYRQVEEDSAAHPLFKKFFQEIAEKYDRLVSADVTDLDILKWCYSNDYMAPAIAVYIEKMPAYICNSQLPMEAEALQKIIVSPGRSAYYSLMTSTEYFMEPTTLERQRAGFIQRWLVHGCEEPITAENAPQFTSKQAGWLNRYKQAHTDLLALLDMPYWQLDDLRQMPAAYRLAQVIYLIYGLPEEKSPYKKDVNGLIANLPMELEAIQKDPQPFLTCIRDADNRKIFRLGLASTRNIALVFAGIPKEEKKRPQEPAQMAERAMEYIQRHAEDFVRLPQEAEMAQVKKVLEDYYFMLNQRNHIMHAGNTLYSLDEIKARMQIALERLESLA